MVKKFDTRVDIAVIKQNSKDYNILSQVCAKAKLLYNSANYYQKQKFISSGYDLGSVESAYELRNRFIGSDVYKDVGGHIAAEVCFLVARNWKSYKESYTKWHKEYRNKVKKDGIVYKKEANGTIKLNKKGVPIEDKSTKSYLGQPKCPSYNEGVLQCITLDCGSFAQYDNYIKLPKRLGNISLSYNESRKINCIRIRPASGRFIIELVYKVDVMDMLCDSRKYMGIDLGINNFATIVSNTGMQSVVVDGKSIKSKNQYWNKSKAHYQEVAERMNGVKITKHINALTNKRNMQVKDFIHKATRYIVDLAVSENICTIYVGKNENWKQKVNLGKKTNQIFTQIPFARFIDVLTYKCAFYGIKVVTVNEAYSSKCSFLDNEDIKKHSTYMGKRIKRGLFRASSGRLINADVNAAYNILKKGNVTSKMINESEKLSGCSLHPVRVVV